MKASNSTNAEHSLAQTKDAVDPNGGIDLRNLFTQATLCDLAHCSDVEVSIKHNNVDMQIKQSANIVNVNMRWYGNVAGATLYVTERVKPKYRLTQAIIELRAEGKTQAQVAKILGISQAYVSLLERQYKQRHNIA